MKQTNEELIKTVKFTVQTPGRYAISITAICDDSKSDLRVVIDDVYFRELPPIKNVTRYNHPAAWNGTKMLGKPQTNIFILDLKAGNHRLTFYARGNVHDINFTVNQVSSQDQIELSLNLQADNYERQPFVNVILVNMPLAAVGAKVATKWHFKDGVPGDGDDVCLFIDNELYSDDSAHRWMWNCAPTVYLANKNEFHSVCPSLDTGIHYLEFYADRSPTINSIRMQLRPVFQGDYWLKVAAKITPDNKYKHVLGVYIPSGNQEEINNDNVSLYYKGEELRVGTNEIELDGNIQLINDIKKAYLSWENDIFDFSGFLINPDGNWFYYGIDTGWMWKRILINDWGWWDPGNWKLVKHS